MHPTPAIELLAPSSSLSSDHETPGLERRIGEAVAAAACAVAQAVEEREAGPLPHATKMRGGELIATLFELRQGTAGELDFDSVAKTQGALTLLELCGTNVSAAMIGELVNGVLEILGKVVRSQSH